MRPVRSTLPACSQSVMAGLDPAIHDLDRGAPVDDRDKPGHDDAVDGERLLDPLRLSPAGGVRLTGIDLAEPLSPAAKDEIVAAFLAHHIVVFPEQPPSREQQ